MRIADGQLTAEQAADLETITRKAGLSPWHARLLAALERIAAFYDQVPPTVGGKRRGDSNA